MSVLSSNTFEMSNQNRHPGNSSGIMGKVMQVETLSIKRLALWCEWEESTSHRGQSLHNGVRIEQGNFNYSMDDVTGVWGNCCQSKQLGSSVCLWRHTTPHDPGWSLLATLVVFEGLFSPTVTIHINIMCMNDWNASALFKVQCFPRPLNIPISVGVSEKESNILMSSYE